MTVTPQPGERLELATDDDFVRHAHEAGWTDGLPVVAPTQERLEAMLAAAPQDPMTCLGVMAPGQGVVTVEAVAVNAVMAGCEPEHLPVVLAAVRALLRPEFNLYGVQTTTNPVTPLVLVGGPIVAELGFHGGNDCFGPGWRANAVVGRAVRSCLRNIGHARPGETDMSTQGQPGKFGWCFAENIEASPWAPHHVDRGLPAGASCVTVFQAGMFSNILDAASRTPDSLLASVAEVMSVTNSNNMQLGAGDLLLALGPEHAANLARGGLSKDDVRRRLHERARATAGRIPPAILACVREWRSERYGNATDDTEIPVVDDWRDIHVVVAGGRAGAHSAFIPGFGDGRSVCVEV